MLKLEAAQGKLLSQRGAFDPVLSADGKAETGSYYDTRRVGAELNQPTTLWGTELFVGYRFGRGVDSEERFPTYYDDETLPLGEVRAGARVPLLRDGAIDRRRFERLDALFGVRQVGQEADLTERDVSYAASLAYWKWVVAGAALQAAKQLQDLAVVRDRQLRERLEGGAISRFDVTDNERLVLKRRARLVMARRSLREMALKLSLYLRDETGRPVVPTSAGVPDVTEVVVPDLPKLKKPLALARRCHPMVLRAEAEVRRAKLFYRFARNRLLPKLDVKGEVRKDLGDDDRMTIDGDPEFVGQVTFEVPLLFRDARGKVEQGRAEYRKTRTDREFQVDRIEMFVLDTHSAIGAAIEASEVARSLVKTTRELADGERERFFNGASNLLFVNIREEAVADAIMGLAKTIGTSRTYLSLWRVLTELAHCT